MNSTLNSVNGVNSANKVKCASSLKRRADGIFLIVDGILHSSFLAQYFIFYRPCTIVVSCSIIVENLAVIFMWGGDW